MPIVRLGQAATCAKAASTHAPLVRKAVPATLAYRELANRASRNACSDLDLLVAAVQADAVAEALAEEDIRLVANKLARPETSGNKNAVCVSAASLEELPPLRGNEVSRGRARKGAPRDDGRELLGEPASA